jgi:hypothetical protein
MKKNKDKNIVANNVVNDSLLKNSIFFDSIFFMIITNKFIIPNNNKKARPQYSQAYPLHR